MGYAHLLMPTLAGPGARPDSFWVDFGDRRSLTVTAEQAAAIADAWRAIEQAILERTHGPQDVW